MRKVVSILVSLMLLVSIVSQSAFATTPIQFGITVGSSEGSVGSTVKVPVSLFKGVPTVNNLDFRLAYDSNALELISIDPGEIVPNPTVNFSSYISSGKVSLMFVDETDGKEQISKSGIFANLNFKIKTATKSQITFNSLGALNEMQLEKSSAFCLIEGSVSGTEISTKNSVTPSNVKVDKAALSDVSVAVTPESNFADIRNASVSLIKDKDYTISGANLVIKKSYLNYYFTKFPEQNLNLAVMFKSGNNANLCIYTGTSSLPSISPSSFAYNVEASQDIAIKTELNGNYIASITTGATDTLLVPRIDYTYSTTDKTIIIRKGFLRSCFNGSQAYAKFAINFTGGSRAEFTVNALYPQLPHNELLPASATFEAGKASDIVVRKTPGGTTFKGITYNAKQLIDGKDYTVSGDKITLNASFLNKLSEGTSTLVFGIQQGNSVNFNITVTKPQVTTNAGITATIGSVKVDADNTAIVPVSFNNVTTPINNIDFKLSYDAAAVSSATVTPGEIVPNPAVNFLSLVSNGKVSILFTDDTQKSQQITKDGVFAYIKIKLKDGYSGTAIKLLSQGACSDVNLKEIPVTFVDGKVTKDQTKGVTITVGNLNVEAPANNTVILPVSIKGITTPINNIDFKLGYDVNAVYSVTVTPGDIVPNPTQNFGSSVIDGKITFLFADGIGTEQITKDGVFANIVIKFKAGSANMPVKLLQKGACCDSKFEDIPVSFVDGGVSLIIPPPIENKGITITAGGPNVVFDDSSVILPVSIKDITAPINNIDFSLSYDEKAVDSITVTPGDIVTNPSVNFSYNASKGKIVMMFVDQTQSSEPIKNDGVFANIKIKFKAGSASTPVKLLQKGACNDSKLANIPMTFVDCVASKGIVVTLKSPKINNGIVTLPISINGITSSLNNLDFKLGYDQKAVDVVSVTAGDIVPNPNVNFSSSVSNGKIVLLFTDETQGSQQITKDGVFANITFKVKTAYTDSTVRIADEGVFCDANLTKIPVTFNYGIVNPQ